MTERDLDLVLYGASGFTGRQAAAYIASHAHAQGLRWGIAGRDAGRLERVRAAMPADGNSPTVLIAQSNDEGALDALAARTRVVASTAGPFAIHGHALVSACVRQRTHYTDITGETPWVREVIDRHHVQAAADGTRIVPCCGFDSVPADLGVYLVNHLSLQQFGARCPSVQSYYHLRGGINGGTLASMFHLRETGAMRLLGNPYLLCPDKAPPAGSVRGERGSVFWPRYDHEIGSWVGPFFMEAINRQVVQRSAALWRLQGDRYDADFDYREWFCFGQRGGLLLGIAMQAGLALFLGLMSTPLAPLLRTRLPQPGEGPSQTRRDSGMFNCTLLGRTTEGHTVRVSLSDRGDPGNRVTVKCLVEAALCLVHDTARLPGGAGQGGVLTPATAFGAILVERLQASGMAIVPA